MREPVEVRLEGRRRRMLARQCQASRSRTSYHRDQRAAGTSPAVCWERSSAARTSPPAAAATKVVVGTEEDQGTDRPNPRMAVLRLRATDIRPRKGMAGTPRSPDMAGILRRAAVTAGTPRPKAITSSRAVPVGAVAAAWAWPVVPRWVLVPVYLAVP